MKKLLNNKGSALVWAVCSMMVLTMIVAGILTLGLDYYKRSLDAAAEQSAKLIAQSGANYAVDRMTGRLAYESDVDIGVWMNIDGKVYDKIAAVPTLADGKPVVRNNASVTPVKVYFDNTAVTELEKWLVKNRPGEEFVIDGTDAVPINGAEKLAKGEKQEIIDKAKGGTYAELYFSVQKANLSDASDTTTFIVKVTSTAVSGDYSAQCCANFVGSVIRSTNENGDREVICTWNFLGFSET